MDLYIEGIKNNILLENGQISPWTYKNVVKLGLGLKRFEWVESFVREYSQYLSAREREDAYHFNLADLFFLALLLMGYLSYQRLPLNLFPDIQTPRITIVAETVGLEEEEAGHDWILLGLALTG